MCPGPNNVEVQHGNMQQQLTAHSYKQFGLPGGVQADSLLMVREEGANLQPLAQRAAVISAAQPTIMMETTVKGHKGGAWSTAL